MTANEKRNSVIKKYDEILGRNKYSQKKRDYCYKKHSDGNYYSDCSSSISYAYKEAGFSFGILNTVGMYNSEKLTDVPVEIKDGIIQNPEVLRPCDLLLFAGEDSSRASAGYVGHVEMVSKIVSNKVTIYGHGSGTPRAAEMIAYCKSRYSKKTNTKLGHKGLIRVRRYIPDDAIVSDPTETAPLESYVMITGGTVNIRSKPDATSRKLGWEKSGTILPPRDVKAQNGFVAVEYKGVDAWVSAKYCKVIAVRRYVKIVNGNCYVRTEPSTNGRILGTAKRNSEHTYAGETSENGWLLIEYEGRKGWVSGVYAELKEG